MLGLGNSLSNIIVPAAGASGVGLSFDGTGDNISFGNTNNFGTADFTLTAWVYRDDHSAAQQTVFFQSFNGANYFYWQVIWTGSVATLKFVHGGSGVTTGTNYQTTGDLDLMDINAEWGHVALSVDRDGKIVAYLNGVADSRDYDTPTASDEAIGSSSALTLGGGILANGNGILSNVAVFNGVLNTANILEIYNGGGTFDLTSNSGNYDTSSNLTGWWKLDEGEGSTVADSSTNSNAGTISGATWVANGPS